MRTLNVLKLLSAANNSFDQHNMASYASAIAYHGIISLGPLLLFAISVASMFIAEDVAEAVLIRGTEQAVGPNIAPLIANVVGELSRPTMSNVLFAISWLCITFYAASNVFRHLVVALDAVWEVKRTPIDKRLSFIRRQFIRLRTYVVGLVTALAIIVILLISLIARATVDASWQKLTAATPQLTPLLTLISYVVIPLIIFVFSLLAFKLLPNMKIPWRDVWPGAAFTGIVLATAESIIGYFASRTYIATFYGTAGSVVVLMLWAYFSAFIVLLGAEFTKTYAYAFGSMRTR